MSTPSSRALSLTRAAALATAVSSALLQPPAPASAHFDVPVMWRAILDGSPGWVTEEYGMPDANRCLADLSQPEQSDRTAPGSGLGLVHTYRKVEVKGKDCLAMPAESPPQHVEGIARIPIPGREILFFSYIDQSVELPTLLVPYPVRRSIERIVRVDVRDSEHLTEEEFLLEHDDRDAEVRWCEDVGAAEHVGGMQALGDYLFAGVEGSDGRGRVDIYRVKENDRLYTSEEIRKVASVKAPSGANAHYVMATRLRDGRYFMTLNRGNPGTFSLFWAPTPEGPWEYIADQKFPDVSSDWNAEGERWQSANFVTDCTGKLYIVALGQSLGGTGWRNPNEVHMFAVTLRRDPDNRPLIADLKLTGFFAKDYASNTCEMRGAGGTHITPSGRLALYCGPDREFEVAGHDFRFASIRPPEPEYSTAECVDGATHSVACPPGMDGVVRQRCVNGRWTEFERQCTEELPEGDKPR